MGESTQSLFNEARLFARYLLRATPSRQETRLYVQANRRLFAREETSPALRAARKTPALLGPLDAAVSFWAPDHLLRKKLLTMMAILETTPGRAHLFLSEDQGLLRLLATILWHKVAALLALTLGTVALAFIEPPALFARFGGKS